VQHVSPAEAASLLALIKFILNSLFRDILERAFLTSY
jgi:hypothetical protein